jgi:hypothetical protein
MAEETWDRRGNMAWSANEAGTSSCLILGLQKLMISIQQEFLDTCRLSPFLVTDHIATRHVTMISWFWRHCAQQVYSWRRHQWRKHNAWLTAWYRRWRAGGGELVCVCLSIQRREEEDKDRDKNNFLTKCGEFLVVTKQNGTTVSIGYCFA